MTEQELAELDLAVATAEGMTAALEPNDFIAAPICYATYDGGYYPYNPSTSGKFAMALLVKYELTLCPADDDQWESKFYLEDEYVPHCAWGKTPCEAICKSVVALVTLR